MLAKQIRTIDGQEVIEDLHIAATEPIGRDSLYQHIAIPRIENLRRDQSFRNVTSVILEDRLGWHRRFTFPQLLRGGEDFTLQLTPIARSDWNLVNGVGIQLTLRIAGAGAYLVIGPQLEGFGQVGVEVLEERPIAANPAPIPNAWEIPQVGWALDGRRVENIGGVADQVEQMERMRRMWGDAYHPVPPPAPRGGRNR